jgi:hypothetical protein
MENVAIPDFTSFPNAISPSPDPPPIASHATFEVVWQGGGDRLNLRDETFDVAGEFVGSEATISLLRCEQRGPTYSSVAAGQSIVGSAVGRERNGVYFK